MNVLKIQKRLLAILFLRKNLFLKLIIFTLLLIVFNLLLLKVFVIKVTLKFFAKKFAYMDNVFSKPPSWIEGQNR